MRTFVLAELPELALDSPTYAEAQNQLALFRPLPLPPRAPHRARSQLWAPAKPAPLLPPSSRHHDHLPGPH